LRSRASELDGDVVTRCEHVVDLQSAVGEPVRPHLRELDRARRSAKVGVRADEHDLTVSGHELRDLVELPLVPVVVQAARDTNIVLLHQVLLSVARRAHLLAERVNAHGRSYQAKGFQAAADPLNTCSSPDICPVTSAAPPSSATREMGTRAIPSAGSNISSS